MTSRSKALLTLLKMCGARALAVLDAVLVGVVFALPLAVRIGAPFLLAIGGFLLAIFAFFSAMVLFVVAMAAAVVCAAPAAALLVINYVVRAILGILSVIVFRDLRVARGWDRRVRLWSRMRRLASIGGDAVDWTLNTVIGDRVLDGWADRAMDRADDAMDRAGESALLNTAKRSFDALARRPWERAGELQAQLGSAQRV